MSDESRPDGDGSAIAAALAAGLVLAFFASVKVLVWIIDLVIRIVTTALVMVQ